METRTVQYRGRTPPLAPVTTATMKNTILFYNFRFGLSANQCQEEMKGAFGEGKSTSVSTVKRLYLNFKTGHCSTEDESREGSKNSVRRN